MTLVTLMVFLGIVMPWFFGLISSIGVMVTIYVTLSSRSVSTKNYERLQAIEIKVNGRVEELLEITKRMAELESRTQSEAISKQAAVTLTAISQTARAALGLVTDIKVIADTAPDVHPEQPHPPV